MLVWYGVVWYGIVWYSMLELKTEKEGCMSYTTREDAQRPRAVYDIQPDFRGI